MNQLIKKTTGILFPSTSHLVYSALTTQKGRILSLLHWFCVLQDLRLISMQCIFQGSVGINPNTVQKKRKGKCYMALKAYPTGALTAATNLKHVKNKCIPQEIQQARQTNTYQVFISVSGPDENRLSWMECLRNSQTLWASPFMLGCGIFMVCVPRNWDTKIYSDSVKVGQMDHSEWTGFVFLCRTLEMNEFHQISLKVRQRKSFRLYDS